MGIALVTVTMRVDGEEFSNTHAVAANGGYDTPIDEGELNSIGASASFLDGATDPTNVADYLGATYLLQAIVGFQRLLAGPWVQFVRLYVTDGRRNDGGNVVFFTTALSGAGLRDVGLSDETDAAPGNVVLQVTRQPTGLSARVGRLQLRGVLLDVEVRLGGPKLVDFTSDATRTLISLLLTDALNTSELAEYLAGGSQAVEGSEYALPSYGAADTPMENQLVLVRPVRRMLVAGVRSRQVSRGRRETPAVAALRNEIAALRKEVEEGNIDLLTTRAYQNGFIAGSQAAGGAPPD